jgi:hypothetical protein
MPGFLSGVEEGMGKKKKDDGGKDDDKKPALAKTLGKAIAGKFGKKSSSTPASDSGGGDDSGPGYAGGFKRGGKVKKTGIAKVHKGERVLTKKQAKKYSARKRQRR